MKRKFVQIAALCLSAALLLALGGEKAAASPLPSVSTDRIIRVGLHYGTGTMAVSYTHLGAPPPGHER
ncbi:MAG: hypothetical protein K2M15_00415, partial [Oscillospiraceae bacterium]|nr:hypothetical protein [Oscillospiraceae bacterium]